MDKLIPLTRGLFAIVSPDDFERVSTLKWHAAPRNSSFGGYAAVHGKGGVKPSANGRVYMHRFILEAPSDLLVDHVNRNALDNRRENIRLCDHSLNCVNRVGYNPRSGYRGVWQTRSGRWQTRVFVHRKQIEGGTFAVKEDAARRYDEIALHYFGEFAQLNFPSKGAA